MTRNDIIKRFPNASPDFIAANCSDGSRPGQDSGNMKAILPLPKKRFRQETKPLMNGLEQKWLDRWQILHPTIKVRVQAKRYRLGNGKWYKPDFTALISGMECAWEVKGKKAFRDAMDTIKWAAHEWPEVTFCLEWVNDDGSWESQIALP